MYGLLFDIDGCLTLPTRSTSELDIELMDQLLHLNNPLALVTGRSDGWLRKHYQASERTEYYQFPTYLEFGLVYMRHGQILIQHDAEEFLRIRSQLIQALSHTCEQENIYFESEKTYHDYPDHDSLWIETKHVQLSIAANTGISPDKVHQLCQTSWSKFQDQVRILYHHLGVDVIPRNWSKKEATRHFIADLDQSQFQWVVFGDNESDQEMMEGLDQVEFVSTKDEASTKVRAFLQSRNII